VFDFGAMAAAASALMQILSADRKAWLPALLVREVLAEYPLPLSA
jgi:hypothetical protein